MRRPTITTLPFAVAILLCASATTHAQESDGLKLSAGVTQMHDSNLFRLSSSADVLALTGKSSAADDITITTAAISFNKSYSLQRIELGVDLANYSYRNFSGLDFTGQNYNADWFWSLTPQLHGELSTKHTEAPSSYADSSNYLESSVQTTVKTGFNAEYEVGANWRLLGGVSNTSQSNQQVLLADSDYTADNAHVGLRYALASGSSLTYRYTSTDGSYQNRALSASSLYDDGYQQTSNDINLNWVISDKSSAVISLGQVDRTHPNYAQRNYGGTTAGASLYWSLTGKAGLALSWARSLGSYQTSTSNYKQTDTFTVSPSWQIGAKTVLRASYALAQLDYLGTPFGAVASPRSDTTHDVALSINWQPYRAMTLNAALQNSRRDSNQAGLDYTSNSATLSAQLSF